MRSRDGGRRKGEVGIDSRIVIVCFGGRYDICYGCVGGLGEGVGIVICS